MTNNLIIDLMLLSIIIIFIVDISGVINSIKYGIGKILNIKKLDNITIKPFDCSLCCIFWVGLIYLLITKQFNLLGISAVTVFSFLSTTIQEILFSAKDTIDKLIRKFNNLIK